MVDGRLVGTFDWDLVADTSAVLAGFAASCYAASPTGPGGLSTPNEVVTFLRDFEQARRRPLSESERRTAAGEAAWILSFNTRWQTAVIVHGLSDAATIDLVQEHQEDYLSLRWN